jgi:hypothetical protein
MTTESEAFTVDDVLAFLREASALERQHLAGRLVAASERLAHLAPRIGDSDGAGDGDWSAIQLLAHVAMVTRFYGWLAHEIGTGRTKDSDLLPQIRQRDHIGAEMAALPRDQLLAMSRTNLARSAAYLRTASFEDLRRTATLAEGLVMSAEEVARLQLCVHVEDHLDQMERTLLAGGEPR